MKPTTLMLSSALASVMLIAPSAFQNANAAGIKINPKIVKVKPKIKIRPKISLRVDVTSRTEKLIKKRSSGRGAGIETDAAKAGPQPEPPANRAKEPRKMTRFASGSIPRPTPRPELDGASDLNELFEVAGGNMKDLLDVSKMLKDGLEGQNALPDHFGADEKDLAGGIGGDRPFGSNRVGAWDALGGRGTAFGPGGANSDFGVDMMSGVPRSPASQAPHGGGSASSGWTKMPGNSAGRTVWTRDYSDTPSQGGFDVFVRQNGPDGSIHAEITHEDANGNVTGTTSIHVSAPNAKGQRTVTTTYSDGNNDEVEWLVTNTTKSNAGPTPEDQNANGIPDTEEHAAGQALTTPPGEESQPDPVNGGAAEGICNGWNPLTGCGRPGPTLWETLTQPGTSEDSTVSSGRGGATSGPEAVTNPGDGSFMASGNTGGSGGRGLDPCAIQGGGDCGTGPDGLGGLENPAALD